MPVSKHQVSSVIAAYMKNMRIRTTIHESVKDDEADIEIKISKKAQSLMYDRITEELKRKLKKS